MGPSPPSFSPGVQQLRHPQHPSQMIGDLTQQMMPSSSPELFRDKPATPAVAASTETTSTPIMKEVNSSSLRHLAPASPSEPDQVAAVTACMTAVTAASPSEPDLVSIPVLMVDTDGSQSIQTIRLPRSVAAGVSDQPTTLTVTPKTGINKGQKQVLVLTRNSAGMTSCHVRPPPGPPETAARTVTSSAVLQVTGASFQAPMATEASNNSFTVNST